MEEERRLLLLKDQGRCLLLLLLLLTCATPSDVKSDRSACLDPSGAGPLKQQTRLNPYARNGPTMGPFLFLHLPCMEGYSITSVGARLYSPSQARFLVTET